MSTMPSSPDTPGHSLNDDDTTGEGLTAYNSLNKGDATTSESSLGEEGLTTSHVNRAANDDSGSDADETREHGTSGADAGNATELDYGRDARVARDTREDAGNGAGSDAGRPPLRNGDTGYAG